MLTVMMGEDEERAALIGELWAMRAPTPWPNLIDCEEDGVLRGFVVGMLRESERR